MKKWLFVALSLLVSSGVAAVDQQSMLDEARTLVKTFKHRLKVARKHGLSEGGAVKALEVCHLKAPDIAVELSDSSGWVVRRTTMQTRDLDNAPDKWEMKVLEAFEQRHKVGTLSGNPEYFEQTKIQGRPVFRYMKAIFITRSCLKCHGENPRSGVAAELDSLYPFDQATGYKEGDLRGAYTLVKPIK